MSLPINEEKRMHRLLCDTEVVSHVKSEKHWQNIMKIRVQLTILNAKYKNLITGIVGRGITLKCLAAMTKGFRKSTIYSSLTARAKIA